jgi:hypothetical protein
VDGGRGSLLPRGERWGWSDCMHTCRVDAEERGDWGRELLSGGGVRVVWSSPGWSEHVDGGRGPLPPRGERWGGSDCMCRCRVDAMRDDEERGDWGRELESGGGVRVVWSSPRWSKHVDGGRGPLPPRGERWGPFQARNRLQRPHRPLGGRAVGLLNRRAGVGMKNTAEKHPTSVGSPRSIGCHRDGRLQ